MKAGKTVRKTGLFVSGTDTGVGKTTVSALLLSSLQAHGIRSGYFKPVQTGEDLDTDTVAKGVGLRRADLPSPTYFFSAPMAPYRAALLQREQIEFDRIYQTWNELEDRVWIVEGAGGLLVPLNGKQTIRDLIQALELKLLLVASTRLGTINHTLLSIEAARTAGIQIAGIVLVGEEDSGLDKILTDFTQVPVLTRIPIFKELNPTLIQQTGSVYFSDFILKLLFGETVLYA